MKNPSPDEDNSEDYYDDHSCLDDLVQSHIRLLFCHIEPREEMIMIVMIFT
jgi:glucose-6-phosphate 1-dehydrogenase